MILDDSSTGIGCCGGLIVHRVKVLLTDTFTSFTDLAFIEAKHVKMHLKQLKPTVEKQTRIWVVRYPDWGAPVTILSIIQHLLTIKFTFLSKFSFYRS